MNERQDPEQAIDDAMAGPEEDVAAMEDRESRLEHEIEEVREGWEDLQQDRSVPGAQGSQGTEDRTRQDIGEPPPGTE